jgi:hypothetical protein
MLKINTPFGKVWIAVNNGDDMAKLEAEDPYLLEQLRRTMGRDHMMGESGRAADLEAALINLGLDYEILEGAEILEMEIEPLPEGAIP